MRFYIANATISNLNIIIVFLFLFLYRQPLSEVILRLRVMLDNAPTQDQKLVATPKNKNTTDFFPPMKVALKESITVCKTERSNSESSLEMGTETAVVDVDDMSVSEGAVEVRSVTAFLNQGVVPVLMSLLEPPSMEHVRRLERCRIVG